jgi:uncharacterized protein with FMN-binding domain
MEPQQNNKKFAGISISIIALVALIGVIVFGMKKDQVASTETQDTQTPDAQGNTVATGENTNTTTLTYKDGVYTATGSYMSPGGPDTVGVTLTIKNDTVTNASVTPGANDKTSEKFQKIFIDNYTPYVVGKNIDSINLTKVSGSSLTSIGFNEALKKIKAEAKA